MSTRKLISILFFVTLSLLFAEVAQAAKPDAPLSFSGVVVHNNFEGGFFGILDDNGGKYDPINLPKEFQKAGLRVKVVARPKPGMMSFHMWGQIIEIVKIERTELQADKLREVPQAVTIDERTLSMKGSIIRNLMPTIGPRRGSNTYLVLRIKVADDKEMPKDLKCTAVHCISSQEVWAKKQLEVHPGPRGMQVVARQTPAWKKPIDVVVTLQDAEGKERFLRTSGVEVMEVH